MRSAQGRLTGSRSFAVSRNAMSIRASSPSNSVASARSIQAAKMGDFKEYDRLSAEQLRLGRFRPWVQHSFEENAKPVVFHARMLADFNTVDELAHKMLSEFVRPPAA